MNNILFITVYCFYHYYLLFFICFIFVVNINLFILNFYIYFMEFWKIIVGAVVGFGLFLLIIMNLNISLSSVADIKSKGLEEKIIYLGEGDICGVLNSVCKPGLVCVSELESDFSGGMCVRPNISGPFPINPETPKFNESNYDN
jgi:hypothetical protein